MTYRLKFLPAALKEWNKLAPTIKNQFKKKLAERLEKPHVPSARLSAYDNVYKIKLRSVGYRLVYEIDDREITVYVIAAGKRSKDAVYNNLRNRMS